MSQQNTKILTVVFALFFVGLFVWFGEYLGPRIGSEPNTSGKAHKVPRDTQRILNSMKEKGFDHLIKATNYPPVTDREKAQWEWYRSISKIDPSFDWKMPIEFYGKVVDEYEQPIVGASAVLTWTISQETPWKSILTDHEGRFQIANVLGKILSVRIYHTNYYGGMNSYGSYEYADFSQNDFHTPDSNNPVIFRLKKKGPREPMYRWDYCSDIQTNGRPIWFDVARRRVGETGDFGVAYKRQAPERGPDTDFTVTFIAAPGAGLLLSEEEFMFEAPIEGYRNLYSFEEKGLEPGSKNLIKSTYYLRTTKGHYAKVNAEVAQYNSPGGQVNLSIYHNPSGSRNLEYDSNLRIEDP